MACRPDHVVGLCCRDFGDLVIWTQHGVAVLNRNLSSVEGSKARLGDWISCRVRKSDSPVKCAFEFYQYMVVEYTVLASRKGYKIAVFKFFAQVECDIKFSHTTPRGENVFTCVAFPEIDDPQNLIENPHVGDVYHVFLQNRGMRRSDGLVEIQWAVRTLFRRPGTGVALRGQLPQMEIEASAVGMTSELNYPKSSHYVEIPGPDSPGWYHDERPSPEDKYYEVTQCINEGIIRRSNALMSDSVNYLLSERENEDGRPLYQEPPNSNRYDVDLPYSNFVEYPHGGECRYDEFPRGTPIADYEYEGHSGGSNLQAESTVSSFYAGSGEYGGSSTKPMNTCCHNYQDNPSWKELAGAIMRQREVRDSLREADLNLYNELIDSLLQVL